MAIHYENAPIIEALIDVRVELPPGTPLEVIERVGERSRDNYPKKTPRVLVEAQFSAGVSAGASTRQTPLGFAFADVEDRQIFQTRLDGFTFSRLRPYRTWADLRDEARRLWEIYREVARPARMLRVAVRYINQIDVPGEQVDLEDYFRTAAVVPKDLRGEMAGFFLQVQFPQPDFGGVLVLTESVGTQPDGRGRTVVLDLDVFKEYGDGESAGSDDVDWNLMETLRDRKNQFFEGCITDRTRALFGKRTEY